MTKRRRLQRGGSFLELSLCITPLVLMLWGAMSFGHAVFAYNNVAFLSREGSRWAAVHTRDVNGGLLDPTAVANFTKTRAAGLDKDNLSITANWSDSARAVGSTVTVHVTYAASNLPLNILRSPLTVRAHSTATILY